MGNSGAPTASFTRTHSKEDVITECPSINRPWTILSLLVVPTIRGNRISSSCMDMLCLVSVFGVSVFGLCVWCLGSVFGVSVFGLCVWCLGSVFGVSVFGLILLFRTTARRNPNTITTEEKPKMYLRPPPKK